MNSAWFNGCGTACGSGAALAPGAGAVPGCEPSAREVSLLNAPRCQIPPFQPGHSSPSLWIALKGHEVFLSTACFFPLRQEEDPTWSRSFLGGQKHPAASGSPLPPFVPVPKCVRLLVSNNRTLAAPCPGISCPTAGSSASCSGTSWLVWFGACCSPFPPGHVIFPFTAAEKDEALFVPDNTVHLTKLRHQQWGHIP